jgi:hypothetical protein
MRWRSGATAILVAGTIATTGPAGARQASDDWDFGHDPARDLTIAAVTFDNFGVAVRCMGGSLSVVMSGLPSGSGERRLTYRVGNVQRTNTLWVSGRDSTTAFSVWPRAVALEMSRGGPLVVAAPDGERARRYAVELPASPEAIGRVFQACGQTLAPADGEAAPGGESFAGLRWRDQPQISFPGRSRYEGGIAAITCRVQANGGLRACAIESEFPEGSGFGRAAQLGAHRTARVAAADPADATSIEGKSVTFLTRYWTYQNYVQPAPTRLDGPDELNRAGAPPEAD